MPNTPNLRHNVEKTLGLFRIASRITGVFLLVITTLFVIRLTNGTDLWAAGPNGLLTFEHFSVDADGFKTGLPTSGIDLTSIVLIVHGWLYVFYLYTDFRLWSLLQWNLGRFLAIAAGGVVPLLSFFTEARFRKVAETQLKDMK